MKASSQTAKTQNDVEYLSNALNLEQIHKNVSNWNESENYAYLRFLSINSYKFQSKKKKLKRRSLFSIMSDYIVTRSAEQCKSHHQKMIKFYGSIQGVIQRLRKTLHLDDNKSQCQDKCSTTQQIQVQPQVQEVPVPQQNCEENNEVQDIWDFIDDNVWLQN